MPKRGGHETEEQKKARLARETPHQKESRYGRRPGRYTAQTHNERHDYRRMPTEDRPRQRRSGKPIRNQ